jgi:hypothetical protein
MKGLIFAALITVANILSAQNFNVNTTNDAIDVNLGDGVCDDGTGNCTLRAAIQESNALGGTHTITLQSSVYSLSIPGANEDLCSTGDLDISCTIILNGVSAQTTIVDASGLDRVIHVLGSGELTTDEVSFTGGFTEMSNGGGILNNGTINFSNGEIYGNLTGLLDESIGIAGGFGGGIANYGIATLNGVTIRANDATGSEGPRGINGGGGGGSTPGLGGGVFNENGATLTITNGTISGNRAMGGRASRGSANGGLFSA